MARADDFMDLNPWTGETIELYHGTIETFAEAIQRDGVDVYRGFPNSDFGWGFYTTTRLQQAEQWAEEVAADRMRSEPAAVVRFTIPRESLKPLITLAFGRGDATAVDFWSFVHHNRYHVGQPPITSEVYDLVIGPFAKLREDSVIAGWDQFSFHGLRAQQLLRDRIVPVEVLPWRA